MENLSICKSAELCGGCCYQGVPYEEQLKIKENEVREHLSNNGIDPDVLLGIFITGDDSLGKINFLLSV